jgi:hypothetical protein
MDRSYVVIGSGCCWDCDNRLCETVVIDGTRTAGTQDQGKNEPPTFDRTNFIERRLYGLPSTGPAARQPAQQAFRWVAMNLCPTEELFWSSVLRLSRCQCEIPWEFFRDPSDVTKGDSEPARFCSCTNTCASNTGRPDSELPQRKGCCANA